MRTPVRPRFVPQPYQHAAESGQMILRDGSTAHVRLASPEDLEGLQSFFERQSPESLRRRFFSASVPSAESLRLFCDNTDPHSALTLLVTRTEEGKTRIMATGSYLKMEESKAEVAFAVDDALRGKGIGTLLLERLALLAIKHGFSRFWAITHADNRAMRDVFRESGFPVEERLEGCEIEVDLSVIPSEVSVSRMESRERIATAASIRPFFCPRSVAVVGASRDSSKIGAHLIDALLGSRFQGPIYPVNPGGGEIAGLRSYARVSDIPEPVDLAIVAVPRDAVLAVVDDCASRGVRALVIITAGFAEVGGHGHELQRQLVERVRGHGMRMIGPNCMGLINTDPGVSLNATFTPVFPPAGRIAMSSQSGALGLAVLAAASNLDLGLSMFASVGNKADVSGNDLLQYWEEDPGTDAILLYLESFGNPRRFARIARRVSRRKPIVAIKSGRTKAGGRAAGSHTAALAASEVAVDALFRLSGVIRAETLEEMFDLARLLGNQPLPAGRRVGIVTNAGGPAILCADACEAGGLTIPVLSEATQSRLKMILADAASLANPVDMIASATPDQYANVVEAMLASGEIDSLIVIYIPVGLSATSAVLGAIEKGVSRVSGAGPRLQPVLTCLMSEKAQHDGNARGEKIPTYSFPEAAARALGKVAAYTDWRNQPEGVIPDFDDLDMGAARQICQRALADQGACWLAAEDAQRVLQAARLPVTLSRLAHTADEAAARAQELGFPVVLKLASQKIAHKTDVGGVRLNLRDEGAVRQGFEEIREQMRLTNQLDAMAGVIVQPMVSGGIELMVGVTQDPLFGPLVAVGLGGVLVEIVADVCFRIAPLTDRDASAMIRSLRGYRLLQGYRGRPGADLEAIEELLLRISRLAEDVPEISELDLNPVLALPPGQGCKIVDARIAVRLPEHPW